MKHFRHPWKISENISIGRPEIMDNTGRRIAVLASNWPHGAKTDDAHASLIRAAPEMLEILEELQGSASYWSEYDVPIGIVDRINSAVAKARGTER